MTATDMAMPVLGGYRVLVFDAHPDSAAALTAVLRLNGFDARTVGTVAEALAAAKERPSPVLILDPAPFDGDWRKFVRRMKGVAGTSTVVVVTGDTDPRTRQAATDAGAAGFLLKPAEPVKLVELVHRLSRSGPDNIG